MIAKRLLRVGCCLSAQAAFGQSRTSDIKKNYICLMTGYLAQGGNSRRIALIAIVLAHILAIRIWPPISQHQPSRAVTRLPMILHLLQEKENPSPARPKKQNQEPADAAVKQHTTKSVSAQPVAIAAPVVIFPPIPEKDETSVESSHKDIDIAVMIQAAKRDIGKIDRELPGDRPKLYDEKPASLQSKFEKGISGAARTHEDSLEETALPNGRRMTKVTRSGVVYCVYKENSAGIIGGRDTMSEGVRDKVISCPN